MRPSWLDIDNMQGRVWIGTAALAVLAFLAAVAAMDIAQAFLAPTALAILLAVMLSPVQSALMRLHLPVTAAAAITVLSVFAAIGTAVYALLPSYEEWRSRGPELVREVTSLIGEIGRKVSETVENVKSATGVGEGKRSGEGEAVAEPVANAASTVADLLLAAPGIAASLLYVALLTFFLLGERRQIFRVMTGILASDFGGRLRVARSLIKLHEDIARYFFVIATVNIGLGIAVAVAFALIGMPNAPLWGAAMTLLNFVPYLGAATMNAVVFAVALVTFGSVGAALIPTAALLALNTLEGQILTPMILGHRFARSTVAVFIAVAFGAWIWGAIGALIALPVLIALLAILDRMRSPPNAR